MLVCRLTNTNLNRFAYREYFLVLAIHTADTLTYLSEAGTVFVFNIHYNRSLSDEEPSRRSLIGAWICELATTKHNESKRHDPPSMGKWQEAGNSSQEKDCRKKPRRVDLAVKGTV